MQPRMVSAWGLKKQRARGGQSRSWTSAEMRLVCAWIRGRSGWGQGLVQGWGVCSVHACVRAQSGAGVRRQPVTGIGRQPVATVRGICTWDQGSARAGAGAPSSRPASAPSSSSAPQQLNFASSLDQTRLGRRPAADSWGRGPVPASHIPTPAWGVARVSRGCLPGGLPLRLPSLRRQLVTPAEGALKLWGPFPRAPRPRPSFLPRERPAHHGQEGPGPPGAQPGPRAQPWACTSLGLSFST